MKTFLVILFSLFFLPSLLAQVINISKEDRVENFGDGYCAWVSIEILGRYHKIPELYNLSKNRSAESDFYSWDGKKWAKEPYVWVYKGSSYVKEEVNSGDEWAVYSKLNSLGVRFQVQLRGNTSTGLISYAMRNKLGCVFAIEGYDRVKGSWAHAMVLLDFDDEKVVYLDPNYIGKIQIQSRRWFNQHWNGYVVVVQPKEN